MAGLPVVVPPPEHHHVLYPPEQPKHPVLRCILLAFILFLGAGIVACVLVIGTYLVYHPRFPIMSVNTASLNAGYLTSEPDVSGGPMALHADLAALAVISNNNSKIDVEASDVHVGLYYKGHQLGTWQELPATGRQRHGEYVLRTVRFLTGETLVPLPQEDAEEWRNATASGGPVVLELAARFRARLIIGPWLRFSLEVYPHCDLWLKPPPGGALLQSHCRQ